MATLSHIKHLCGPRNPLDLFKREAAKQLSALCGKPSESILPLFKRPRNPENGDMAIAIGQLKVEGNPVQLAKEYSEKMLRNEYITKVTSAGSFLNLCFNKEVQRDMLLPSILELGGTYGQNQLGQGKKILVEFSSPNIAKPFHAGHLRSTIIGNFIANVHAANGYQPITMNYLVWYAILVSLKFSGLLALGFEKYGSEAKLRDDPIKHLFDVYVKINMEANGDPTIHDQARSYFKNMEDGDEETLKLWSRFRDLSIEKYKEVYARLNIQFDIYSGESKANEYTSLAYKLLEQKGLLKDSQGAKVVDLEPYNLGKVVVKKSDGATLYITRDIGAALQRYDTYKFDKMYYVVSCQQNLHMQQLVKILDLLGLDWAKSCHHINFGLVSGMSTRSGNVVFLDDILKEAKETMHAVMQKNELRYRQVKNPEEVADLIGISAVVVQDLSARRIKNYTFDMEQMISFEGDTGPYLQYTHARLTSILRIANRELDPSIDLSTLTEPCAVEALDVLAHFPDLVKDLMQDFEPSTVVRYALKLSRAVSGCLENLWVLNQPDPVALPRLVLYRAAQITLANSLRLIGLTPLERM
ncbi:arginyl-tRNA synthetase [Massospora cicadina]|nr:arginyl-tRNA synthetase [Massospora cicadina]